MKIIEVYKTDKHIKIATLYNLESGSYISSLPISILEIENSLDNLYDEINNILNHSRKISLKEEQKFWLGSDLLKHLKISSFKKLYTTSSCCHIVLENQQYKIVPLNYDTKIKALVESNEVVIFDEMDQVIEFIKLKL